MGSWCGQDEFEGLEDCCWEVELVLEQRPEVEAEHGAVAELQLKKTDLNVPSALVPCKDLRMNEN